MLAAREGFSAALFKPVQGGWVYRSPNPWIFGDTPHYLLNDAQKAQIGAIVLPRRPALLGTLLIIAIFAWVMVVATIVWAFGSGQDNPTAKDALTMAVLIVFPLFAAVPLFAWIQRRRIQPILAGAPLTNERFTSVELLQRANAMTSTKQALNACMSGVVAVSAAVGAAIMHAIWRQYVQAVFWAVLAVVFGLLTLRWYRLVLKKTRKN